MRRNVVQVLRLLKPPCRLLAVVKADAYGFGAREVARLAVEAGASMLGVTFVEEGLELRAAGIAAPILVFAPPLMHEAKAAVRSGLTLTVADLQTARYLAMEARRAGVRAKVHIKVDTGMGRLGVLPGDLRPFLRGLAELPELEVEGVYTHLAAVGKPARRQATTFAEACRIIAEEGWTIALRHVCNSAATLCYPELHLDMVRVGTLIYGQVPPGVCRKIALEDPWTVKARLVQVRHMPAGSRVGYGRGFRLPSPRILGVIPVGFGDGLGLEPARPPETWRELVRMGGRLLLGFGRGYSGSVRAEIRGQEVPVLGRLSMQLAVVDLTSVGGAAQGEEVVIRGLRRVFASARIPRLYLSQGQPYLLRRPEGWTAVSERERRECSG